jgi:hypothetical protein
VLVTVLPRPDPQDPTVYHSRADVDEAIARGRMPAALPSTTREAAFAKAREMARAGCALGEIDGLLSDKLGIAVTTARELPRSKLGISGARGRPRKSQPRTLDCG